MRNRGFTLIEIMISMAGLVILGLGAAYFHQFANTSYRTSEDKMFSLFVKLIGERGLYLTLKESHVSLNLVKLKDDNNQQFFDYTPEVHCVNECSRIVTIRAGQSFRFLTVDKNVNNGRALLYKPVSAYSVGARSGGSWSANGALTFVSLNQGGLLADSDFLKASGAEPGYWSPGRTMLMFAPVAQMGQGSVVSKYLAYVGSVPANGDRLSSLPGFPTGIDLNLKHPLDDRVDITSEDVFLRRLPSVGGEASFALMKVVKLAEYRIADCHVRNRATHCLFFSYFDSLGRQFGEGMMLAEGVEKLILRRKSVSSRIVDFDLVRKTGNSL